MGGLVMIKSMPKQVSVTMVLLLAFIGGAGGIACATKDAGDCIKSDIEEQEINKHSLSTADHTKFEALNQDFKTGPEVTKACLTCHTEASLQLHETYHWTWESKGGVQPGVGKKNVINNF
jgi:hypothetical protein